MWDDFEALRIFFVVFWFAVFIISLKLELLLKQLSLISITFASLFTGIFGTLFSSVPMQIILFLILGLIIRISIHPAFYKKKVIRIFENQIAPFIGREAIVSKDVSKDIVGEVAFNGMRWEASTKENQKFLVGEKIVISDKEGIVLLISKSEDKLNLVTNK